MASETEAQFPAGKDLRMLGKFRLDPERLEWDQDRGIKLCLKPTGLSPVPFLTLALEVYLPTYLSSVVSLLPTRISVSPGLLRSRTCLSPTAFLHSSHNKHSTSDFLIV